MRSAMTALALAVVVAVGVFAVGDADSGRAAPSRTIDRTLLCSTVPLGGLRQITVRAHAGVRERPSEWKQLAFAVVATGTTASLATSLDNSLAWITAGSPSGTTTMDSFATYPHTDGTLALSRTRCRPSAVRVPLTARSLEGGAASPLRDEYDCPTPQRVLVRVRGTLQSPAGLGSTGLFLRTTTPLNEAQLAVRTRAGRALAFARVFRSGKTQLFTAASCVPD